MPLSVPLSFVIAVVDGVVVVDVDVDVDGVVVVVVDVDVDVDGVNSSIDRISCIRNK
jgi:hypothetical protein